MLYDDFLDLLEGVKKSGKGHVALCPAHDDRKPSLSIDDGGDRILLTCQSQGCPAAAIVEALDLKMADLFYEQRGLAKTPEQTEFYAYLDENARPLFRVVRKPGKQFRQERFDVEADKYIPNMDGVETVPYHLDRLDTAPDEEVVYIVEGEKDVHSVEAAGGVATTNPGGAGKWKDSYNRWFEDRDVVIVADRDDVGRKHAWKIQQSLEGIAASVAVVQAKEGKDITDHLDSGWGFDDLDEVDEEPTDGVIFKRFDRIETRDVEWIDGFENMFAYGAIATVVGLPGVNKSTLSALVAASVTKAGRNVVFLASEDDPSSIIKPRLQLAGADITKCFFASKYEDGGDSMITLPHDSRLLEKQIEKANPGLVVVDPVGAHLGGDTDGNQDSSVRRALAPLSRIAAKHGTCVIFVHHLNKGRSRNPITRSGGSIGIIGVSRQALVMGKEPNDPDRGRVIVGFKNNYGPDADARLYFIDNGAVDGHLAIRLSGGGPSRLKVESILGDGTGSE